MKKPKQTGTKPQEEQLPDVSGMLPLDIAAKFEFYNFGHAFEILTQSCKEEWSDLQDCFRSLTIHIADIMQAGRNGRRYSGQLSVLGSGIYEVDYADRRGRTGDAGHS